MGMKWREAGEDCMMRSFINYKASSNVIRVVKSGKMIWAEHVACTAMREMHAEFWSENLT
jgi:hypothetical protein